LHQQHQDNIDGERKAKALANESWQKNIIKHFAVKRIILLLLLESSLNTLAHTHAGDCSEGRSSMPFFNTHLSTSSHIHLRAKNANTK